MEPGDHLAGRAENHIHFFLTKCPAGFVKVLQFGTSKPIVKFALSFENNVKKKYQLKGVRN